LKHQLIDKLHRPTEDRYGSFIEETMCFAACWSWFRFSSPFWCALSFRFWNVSKNAKICYVFKS